MNTQAKDVHRQKKRNASQHSKNTGEDERSKASSRSRSRSVAMNYDTDTDIEDIQTTRRRKRRKCSQPSKNTDDKTEHSKTSWSRSAAMDNANTDCKDVSTTHRRKRRKPSQPSKNTNYKAEHSKTSSLSASMDYDADTDVEEVAAPSAVVGDKDEGEATPTHSRERRKAANEIDLSDVAPQPLICKSVGSVKEGTSKYTNVHFDKNKNKWRVMITIDGKKHHVGYYENEDEAAADYARAVFKYKGNDKARRRKSSGFVIDLSDVPPQPPIPNTRKGPSKYKGAYFDNTKSRWIAIIVIDGKQRYIGSYENEEEAAIDHARAVFKYKGSCMQRALETNSSRLPRTRSCKATRLTAASSNDTYEVEEIVGYRRNNGQVEYLIKWIGYSKEDNSWEPEENLNDVSLEEATMYREALETH